MRTERADGMVQFFETIGPTSPGKTRHVRTRLLNGTVAHYHWSSTRLINDTKRIARIKFANGTVLNLLVKLFQKSLQDLLKTVSCSWISGVVAGLPSSEPQQRIDITYVRF